MRVAVALVAPSGTTMLENVTVLSPLFLNSFLALVFCGTLSPTLRDELHVTTIACKGHSTLELSEEVETTVSRIQENMQEVDLRIKGVALSKTIHQYQFMYG